MAEPAADQQDAPASTHQPAAAAVDANTRGYRLYKQGDLPAALAAFEEAVDLDDHYALAHYNLACTLALLRRAGQICPYDATEGRILDHLERAVDLDPDRRQRMRQDSDLDQLRDTIRYRLLDGGSTRSDADLRKLLSGVEFFGPPQGVWGAVSRLELHDGGQASVYRRVLQADGVIGDWSEGDARWSVSGATIEFQLDGDLQRLTLSPDGDQLVAGDTPLWFDHPHDCSA